MNKRTGAGVTFLIWAKKKKPKLKLHYFIVASFEQLLMYAFKGPPNLDPMALSVVILHKNTGELKYM